MWLSAHARGVLVDKRSVVTPRCFFDRPLRTRGRRCRAAGDQPDSPKNQEDLVWAQLAFPFYLQGPSSEKPASPCREARKEAAGEPGSNGDSAAPSPNGACVWQTIRSEATRDAADEPLLSSFLYASILAHDSFERALAFVLSNRLASAVMLPTQLFEIFHEVITSEPEVREGALADVEACRERALLYYKGYHALQTHRIAHALWNRGQRVMAVALQSRVSEVLAVDIHPAARLGRGILLDHGTGVVIGETAIIGNNVSLLQNVTLGGTGKEVGDRHPKISDGVLIGASATVLGNITVGRGAQIAAGSLVLKPVPPHTMVAGSPAKPVGKLFGNPALDMQQWSRKFNDDDSSGERAGEEPVRQRGIDEGGGGGTSSSDRGSSWGASSTTSGAAEPVASSSINGVFHANGHTAPSDHQLLANGTSGSNGRTPVTLNSGHEQAADESWDEGPAPLRGVYEGDVDATMDEEAAAVLWPQQEDPEYVI